MNLSLLLRRVKHLAPCASPFERKIDRAFADWSCAMTYASVYGDHVSRQELDRSIIEVNEEASFQRQKTLIGVGMTVPMVSLGHCADTNFVIVHLAIAWLS